MTLLRTTRPPSLRTGLRATVLAAVGAVALAVPAAATAPTTTDAPTAPPAPVVLTSHLTGAAEVPVAGGPAVGDPDGSGDAAVLLRGDTVDFALSWSKIGAPTRGHIHIGAAGVNGGIEVPFFEKAVPSDTPGGPATFVQQIPDSASGVTGSVKGLDPAVVAAIAASPDGFYVNVHTAEFPGGAVRGQLGTAVSPTLAAALGGLSALEGLGGLQGVSQEAAQAAVTDPANAALVAAVRGPATARGTGTFLGAIGSGAQEVGPDGALGVGDPDGALASLTRLQGRSVGYALAWSGIDPPTRAHLHRGVTGTNGPIVVPFFELTEVGGLPPTVNGIIGQVDRVDGQTVRDLRSDSAGFYANVHTAPFPAGAVRGQLVNLNDLF